MELLERILAGHTIWSLNEYVAQGDDVTNESGRQMLNACGQFGDVSAMKYLIAHGTPLRESVPGGHCSMPRSTATGICAGS